MVPGRQPLSLSNVCRHRCRGVHPLQNDCGHGGALQAMGQHTGLFLCSCNRSTVAGTSSLHNHARRRRTIMSLAVAVVPAATDCQRIDQRDRRRTTRTVPYRTVPYDSCEMVLCERATVDWQRPSGSHSGWRLARLAYKCVSLPRLAGQGPYGCLRFTWRRRCARLQISARLLQSPPRGAGYESWPLAASARSRRNAYQDR